MAERILMINKSTGIQKDGFYGYSWTTLFFGPFVPLFRADFLTFVGYFIVIVFVGVITAGIGGFFCFLIWSFFYNSYYTKKLLEKGYEFSGSIEENEKAAKVLEVQILKSSALKKSDQSPSVIENNDSSEKLIRNLDDDAYKIHLVKNYSVEFNDVLKKHIFNQKLYGSIDDVLVAMHEIESKKIEEIQRLKEIENEKFKGKFDAIRNEAKPYLEIISNRSYELLKEPTVGNAIIWEFKSIKLDQLLNLTLLKS